MAAEWFYRTPEGAEVGPVSAADLKRLAERNKLHPDTPIRKGGDGRWSAAAKVKGLLGNAPVASVKADGGRRPARQGESSTGTVTLEGRRAEPPSLPDHSGPRRSPLLLIAAGVGVLLVAGVTAAAVVMGTRSGSSLVASAATSGEPEENRAAEERRRNDEQERAVRLEAERAAEEQERAENEERELAARAAEQAAREEEQRRHEAWLKSGQEIRQFVGVEDSWFGGVSYSNGIAFSPGGRYVAAASNSKRFNVLLTSVEPNPDFGDSAIYVWDAQTGEVVRHFDPKPFKSPQYIDYRNSSPRYTSIAFSPDERLLAAGRADGTVRVWDVATGNEAALLLTPAAKAGNGSEEVHSLVFSPDGRHLLVTGVGHNGGDVSRLVRLWNVAEGQVAATFTGHSDIVIASAFSPDGQHAVTGSWDRTAIVWDVKTGQEVRLLDAHTGWVKAVAFSPDGSKVLTGSNDRTVRLWDFESGRQEFKVDVANAVSTVAFRPGGKYAIVGTSMHPTAYLSSPIDSNPVMIDLERAAVVKLPVAFMKTPLEDVHAAVSPDGGLVVFTAKKQTRVRGRDVETHYLTLRELPE